MILRRPGKERGHTNIDWLESYHTFSFGGYRDPNWMGFRYLLVINEDWVQPGKGFRTHPHEDMEIVTVVLEGALEHKDSIGNGDVIYPGDVQRMSAGTGILHSEFNPSPTELVHLFQIWLLPNEEGLTPSYEQKSFPAEEKQGKWRVVVAPDGRDGAVKIHQDTTIHHALLKPGDEIVYSLAPERYAWLQVARGNLTLNGNTELTAGDAAALAEESAVVVRAHEDSEVLLFDLS